MLGSSADLYNKKSPGFHKWISQNQFNTTFGPTAQEVKAVQNFLSAHVNGDRNRGKTTFT